MQLRRLGRAAVALVGLAFVAAVLFSVLLAALEAVGLARSTASPAALGGVVSAALAAADVYTPLGNNSRTATLREKPRGALAADFAAASAVGFATGAVAGAVLLSPGTAEWTRMGVVAAAVLLGYGTFVARNVAVYSPGFGAGEDGSEL
ncbi:hypothetical protein [Halobacterium wangiae]|uniref:hypothetical protein n=1 Tax=Halobacterium wangiae TaxID=2902623 RepID=UPI001E4D4CC9|nr:hypothetical protein [Halobacterium wangiae]